METLIDRIESLFAERGGAGYDRSPDLPLSPLSRALQCAQLAEWSGADPALVAAALLHDVGSLADAAPGDPAQRTLQWLGGDLGADVLEPIRLHAAARRYLAATDAAWRADGVVPMSAGEVRAYESEPYAVEAVQLRRWIEQACEPGKRTPTLDYYLHLLDEVLERPALDSKTGIGPISVV